MFETTTQRSFGEKHRKGRKLSPNIQQFEEDLLILFLGSFGRVSFTWLLGGVSRNASSTILLKHERAVLLNKCVLVQDKVCSQNFENSTYLENTLENA